MMSDGFWSRDFSVTNYGQLYYMLACWQATGSRCIFFASVDSRNRVHSFTSLLISHECSYLVISLNFSTDSNKRRT